MGERYGQYPITHFLIGSELARILWAAILGLLGVTSFVLLGAVASAAETARAMYAQYKGFTFREAWQAMIGIQLGLHKVTQLVASGELQTTPAAGPLARFGGPGVLVVEEGHAAVLMASGKVTRVVGNGVTWLRPFERVHMVVYLPSRTEKVTVNNVMTLDQMVLDSLEFLVFHRADRGDGSSQSGAYRFDEKIIREKLWSPKGSDWRDTVKAVSEATIRDVIAQFRFEDIVSVSGVERSDLIRTLTARINEQIQGSKGIEVVGCNIGAIGMSQAAKEALQKKGLAEVERQRQVIEAEAEKEVTARRGEGKAIEIRRIQQEKAAARRELLQQLIEAFRLMTEKIHDQPEFTRNYPDFVKSYMQAIEQLIERIETLDKISTAEGPKTFIVGDTQGFAQSTDLSGTSSQKAPGTPDQNGPRILT
jgi:regulator of protease activity HflC (stomatin/prohibitin superfamily)